jgi:hypothetical protein
VGAGDAGGGGDEDQGCRTWVNRYRERRHSCRCMTGVIFATRSVVASHASVPRIAPSRCWMISSCTVARNR